ncbi:MAG: hypothetical protein J0G32_03695 [Alphaproteobacteria bacterium]|nr:hypothetical protein [Alphaproteobacteria bacterium]OJV16047.1 MAG: hypothetical protein BGO27_04290 [Alphaproteobacteria bacterium 33-17]
MLKYILIAIQILISSLSHAADFKVFPLSTEMQIGKLQPILDHAPTGAFISVGGERSFRGASMAKNIDSLIIIDKSPEIIRFAKINRKLLKAPNKESYKKLRWDANFEEWQKISKSLTESDFKWWNDNIRNFDRNNSYYAQEILNTGGYIPRCNLNGHLYDGFTFQDILTYKSGNYLFDDRLYNKLHSLASNDDIYELQIDLINNSHVIGIIDILKQHNVAISVLDINNLYSYTYLGQDQVNNLINLMLPLGKQDSRLIVMNIKIDKFCGYHDLHTYTGFTFENIRNWPQPLKFETFFNKMPKKWEDLIDGKLYIGKEYPPLPEGYYDE